MINNLGIEDRNCPFAKTEQEVALRREAGARVEFVIQPGVGHLCPNRESTSRRVAWLRYLADRSPQAP